MLHRSRRRCGVAAVVVPVTLFLASCSNGDGDAKDEGSSPDGTAGENAADESSDSWVGPLGELLRWNDDLEVSDDELRQQRRVEELIAECMRDEGFEYVPRDPSEAGPIAFDVDDGPWSLPPDEFAEQYGYGLSTIDPDDDVVEMPDEAVDDPNMKIVNDLSKSARQAYNEALYGDGKNIAVLSGGGSSDVVVPNGAGKNKDKKGGESKPGCMVKANDEVYGSGPTRQERASFQGLENEMDALSNRIENDERVTNAEDEWSDCMAEAGFPEMLNLEDAFSEVDRRVKDVLGNNFGAKGWMSASGDRSGGDGNGEGQQEPDPQAVEELRDFERKVAVADYECRKPYEEIRRKVQTEIENEFIDANREELERYQDVMATDGRGGGVAEIAGG